MVICDEMMSHYAVFAFTSDMDRFQTLMEGPCERYGTYPKYPVADAEYGSFNNYPYCQGLLNVSFYFLDTLFKNGIVKRSDLAAPPSFTLRYVLSY